MPKIFEMKNILLITLFLIKSVILNAQIQTFDRSILLDSDRYVQYGIKRGNGATAQFGITSNSHFTFLSSSGAIKFYTNNTAGSDLKTKAIILENGNVGIGTTSPNQKLEIKGSLLLKSDSYIQYGIERSNGAKSAFGITSNSHNAFLSSSGTLRLVTNHNGNEFTTSMFINNAGNVGIGTSNPKNRLSVKGTIWAEEIKVSLTDAADWVFNDEYNLLPLYEVENFIKLNKHLPEIPSAEEFKKDDLKVSEMINKLLQKIEELTLYTIEQQKEVDKLKIEIQKLKN